MSRADWVWMPHPAHFIGSRWCRFHLATKVGDYIVSTVGEYVPDKEVRRIHDETHVEFYGGEIIKSIGDAFDYDYFQKYGFDEIGADRTYETMVFKAKPSKGDCGCPYHIVNGESLDFSGYNDPTEAYNGHLVLCEKWSEL